jgi:hypothetical protein
MASRALRGSGGLWHAGPAGFPSRLIGSAVAIAGRRGFGGSEMPVTYAVNRDTGVLHTRCFGNVTFDEGTQLKGGG